MPNRLRLLMIGKKIFLIGIFFLASAPFISVIFFLFCLVISFYIQFPKIYKDKWNYPLALAALIMIIITLIHNIYYIEIETEIKEKLFYVFLEYFFFEIYLLCVQSCFKIRWLFSLFIKKNSK